MEVTVRPWEWCLRIRPLAPGPADWDASGGGKEGHGQDTCRLTKQRGCHVGR